MRLDDALTAMHFTGAVGYKKKGSGRFLLAYEHAQKSGYTFGSTEIECYEFELQCLGLDSIEALRRGVHHILPHGNASLAPERPRRFAPHHAQGADR